MNNKTSANVREMTQEDLLQATGWLEARTGIPFPAGAMPRTGLAVQDGTGIVLVLAVYFERSSQMAVLGWCVGNPANRPHQSRDAVRLALAAAEEYARRYGASHLITMFGSRSLNRELERMGFAPGDTHVQQKYKFLR